MYFVTSKHVCPTQRHAKRYRGREILKPIIRAKVQKTRYCRLALKERSVTQTSHSHMSVSDGMREVYKNSVWNHPTAKKATSTS